MDQITKFLLYYLSLDNLNLLIPIVTDASI